MGDSRSSCKYHENGYAGDDSSSNDGNRSSYQNVPPEDGHLGGHSEQNGPKESYSENMFEFIAGRNNEDDYLGVSDIDFGQDEDKQEEMDQEKSYSENKTQVIAGDHNEHEYEGKSYMDIELDKEETLDRYRKTMGTRFGSEPAAYVFYNSYAKDCGFSIRKEKVKRGKGPSGEVRFKRYVCSRAGKRQSKFLSMDGRTRRPRAETRCGCKAQFIVKLDRSSGVWFVGKFVDQHNHTLARPDEVPFLRSHRKIQRADILPMAAGLRCMQSSTKGAPKQNTQDPAKKNPPTTRNGRPLGFDERKRQQVCGACKVSGHNRRNTKCALHPSNMVDEEN